MTNEMQKLILDAFKRLEEAVDEICDAAMNSDLNTRPERVEVFQAFHALKNLVTQT